MHFSKYITFKGSVLLAALITLPATCCGQMMAGVAKVDVTDYKSGPVHDPLYVKALVLKQGGEQAVIVTVDAVAIGGIGYIKDDYLGKVRSAIQETLGIPGTRILVNASHCHGVVRGDIDMLTIDAIKAAASELVPVRIGVGHGHEDRVGENRRLLMKDDREIDVRHAYSMPPDKDVVGVGPIDPEIGVLRLDRMSGTPLAVIYNFACHPIQGVPSGANTADITGLASTVIEDNLGGGAMALFLQGCGGDINPVFYKHVDQPRDAVSLGNLLALSTLKAVRAVETKQDDRFQWIHETLELPRADLASKIIDQEQEQLRLAQSLRGTTLSLKTFLPLVVKYRLSDQYPAYYSHRYLHEEALGRKELSVMDARNRQDIKSYIQNIETMEKLTRVNTNLRLLKMHQKQNLEAPKRTVDVELIGCRIGDFVLTSFPGELTVQIGLNLKGKSPHQHTFIAGYTNGYIYYAPTTEQLANVGGAQEDSDCILAPHWQAIYEQRAVEILEKL
ncbi:MAG: hypothetical protein OSA98_03005 [Rubripirellula sp.]|nr:hypothetical protein [Rubripirellula sp.]